MDHGQAKREVAGKYSGECKGKVTFRGEPSVTLWLAAFLSPPAYMPEEYCR